MLQIKNISKTYKTGDLVQVALDNVSLNLRDNEFVAILGPSGSGKTTLLNIIGGLDRYDDGDLIINGISTKKYKDRDWDTYRNHTIGFVFQSYNLIPHQTILRNVELALTIGGVSAKERKKRALQALDEVGLKDQAHKKPNQMSGGQMQRVAIARALVNNPDILLADEPTGALDTKTSIQVMDLLKKVANDRLVVMVTHNPDLANEYSNRIVQLKDGQIISDSNPYNPQQIEVKKKKKTGKARMNLFTALSLSFNNLLTKKGRTILTAFAGSIGIIGIALILSLSQGFQNYVDKIQEDTMSSYPLTIQSETSSIFQAMLSVRMDARNSEVKDGEVKEQTMISSMMNSVGSNDLRSFKYWLEHNKDKYKDDVYQISYSYSISPRIFTIDAVGNYAQLNPSTLMSSIYSDSAASLLSSLSSSSSSGIFSSYSSEDIQKGSNLLVGRYPEKYNELIIVLSDKSQISDLLVYSLGLRDTKELKTLISQVMAGEQTTINNEPMTFTYQQLMDIDLKLINTSDLYRYNEQYKTYEDMTSDDEYMKYVYNNSEKLKIVGIAERAEENGITGVIYIPELNDHVIEVATDSELVKKQLKNKEVDVFSGNRFDEENKSKAIDFNDMVSVDEDMLKNAFKVNITEDKITALVDPDDMQKIVEDSAKAVEQTTYQLAKSIPEIPNQMTTAITMINQMYVNTMISTYEANAYNNEALPNYLSLMGVDMITNAINADTYKSALQYMSTSTPELATIVENLSDSDYEHLANAAKKSINTYYNTIKTDEYGYNVMGNIVPVTVMPQGTDPKTYMIISYGTISQSINKMNLLNTAVTDTEVVSELGSVIENLTKQTITQIANGIAMIGGGSAAGSTAQSLFTSLGDLFKEDLVTVDTDAFAKAFNFDMDEDELSRLMSSMLTSSNASYSNNLINLGYQDYDEPTSIAIYFNNFDSKENFLNLLDNYNDTVDEEQVISYTDITGLLMSSVKTIIDSVTYVLIAFVSISLIVSSIMIAVITLISVMERTKEIGILRAMGASKHNVSSIFNAETFIIGLLSGLIGVGFTYAVIPPINRLIHNLTNNYDINAVLYTKYAIILVLISVLLTIVAGIIPSRKAAKQDPVIALRTE